MAANAVIGALRASLTMETASFEKGVANAIRGNDQLERKFGRTSGAVSKSTTTMEKSMSSLGGVLRGFAAAASVAGVAALGASFIKLADQSKLMSAQLRLATSSFGTFGQAQGDVQRIASETRNSLEATTSLYGNMVRASEASGRSQEEAARATETFSKGLKIGGAGAAEAASATLQFGQALASGVLRGDEFNSIAEASPRILRLLADSLGVSTGELRKLAAEGKLTRDVLFKALTDTRFTAGIDAEFKQLPITWEESRRRIYDSAVTVFGAFDNGGEFSTALANFVAGGAHGFQSLRGEAEQFGVRVRSVFAGLAGIFGPFEAEGIGAFARLTKALGDLENRFVDAMRVFDTVTNFGAQVWNESFLSPRNLLWRAPKISGTSFAEDYLKAQAESRKAAEDRLFQQQYEALGFTRSISETLGLNHVVPPPAANDTKKAGKTGKTDAERAAEREAKAVQALTDRLYPAEAATRKFKDEQALLVKALSGAPEKLAEAQEILRGQYLDDLIGPARTAKDIVAEWKEPFVEINGLSTAVAQQLDFNARQAADALAALQAPIDDLAYSINHDLSVGLSDLVTGARSFGSVMLDVLDRIGQSIIDNLLSPLSGSGGTGGIGGAIANALGGLLGGGVSANKFKTPEVSAINNISSAMQGASLPGFASGGSFDVRGKNGLDKNVLALNGVPVARVNYGERVDVSPANDRGSRRGDTHISQEITLSGAVDLATREEVYRIAEATRKAAIAGVGEANRRRA